MQGILIVAVRFFKIKFYDRNDHFFSARDVEVVEREEVQRLNEEKSALEHMTVSI